MLFSQELLGRLTAIEKRMDGFALFHDLMLGVTQAPCPVCQAKETKLLRKLAAKYEYQQKNGHKPKRRRK